MGSCQFFLLGLVHTIVFLDRIHQETWWQSFFAEENGRVYVFQAMHTTVFLGKKALPPSFLMDSVKENGRVYEA